MPYIDVRRKDRIRNMVLQFGGSYLENSQIYFAKNPKAANTIAYHPDSKRMYQICIKESYAYGEIELLAAVVAHEVANTQVNEKDPFLSRLEVVCIAVCNRCIAFFHLPGVVATMLRSSIRIFFEGVLLGYRRILYRKILADRIAMRSMHDARYSIQYYFTFLNRELLDRKNFWIPRRWWHRWIVKKRLEEMRRMHEAVSCT